MRNFLRPLYHALFAEEARAWLRPFMYPLDTTFRAILWRSARGRVCSGPFAGLHLAPGSSLSYLTGTAERELHEVVESLCTRSWKKIVNVGGGNGFYIAGLGCRVAGAELVVFELVAEARDVIRDTLARNGLTGRTRVLGAADAAGLEAVLAGADSTLVVMDVEGAELELADPEVVPSLRRATILVETHDLLRAGCRETIAARFAGTHVMVAIPTQPRSLDDFPASLSPILRRIAPARCLDAVQELRGGPQEWLVLTPRAPSGTDTPPAPLHIVTGV